MLISHMKLSQLKEIGMGQVLIATFLPRQLEMKEDINTLRRLLLIKWKNHMQLVWNFMVQVTKTE